MHESVLCKTKYFTKIGSKSFCLQEKKGNFLSYLLMHGLSIRKLKAYKDVFYGSHWSQISLKNIIRIRWDELISKRKRLDIILFPYIGIQQNPQFNNIIQIFLWWELYKHQNQDCYALILEIYHNFILSCVDCTGQCRFPGFGKENVPRHGQGLFLKLSWMWVDLLWTVSSSGFSQMFKNL